ncbi:ROK family protein [Sphaerisporangium rubeum]|uniref:Glucokinase n=1 Tax=Sphaerisporangium rubeum TaxID=321317 RepID=A0A7X0IJG7_9ACTN|nr:ROK family protein [Sphaerisporangium rubeum]MBB6476340.1 glucokinase [Sphaerisporangium rubeum]
MTAADPPASAAGSVLAIDIGGTKFAAGLVDVSGRVLAAEQVATPPGANAGTLWKTLLALVEPLVANGPGLGVGVGCGGPMRWPDGVVSPLNMPGWRDFPLRAALEERFPGVPVRVHNDAICLAVAEHWRGAGQGVADMLGMVVSTGVGGGLILGDRLISGPTGNAGHIGHVVVDPAGPECGCGGHGCLEAVSRGPALAAWAIRQGWIPGAATSGRPEASRLHPVDARESLPPAPSDPSHEAGDAGYEEAGTATARRLAADAAAGDEIALRAMTRAGRALGTAIASTTHLCDLDLVTIGGGLSQAGPLLFTPLEEALRAHARMPFSRRLRVVPASLGRRAGLIGAAALVLAPGPYWTAP